MKPVVSHILFIIAVIMTFVLLIPGYLFTAFATIFRQRGKTWYRRMGKIHHRSAIALDIACNVLFQHAINWTCVTSEARKHNNYHTAGLVETISYVIGMNYYIGSLTRHGRWWYRFLNWLDKHHCEKSLLGWWAKQGMLSEHEIDKMWVDLDSSREDIWDSLQFQLSWAAKRLKQHAI